MTKKKLLALGLAAVLVIALAACGSPAPAPAASEAPAASTAPAASAAPAASVAPVAPPSDNLIVIGIDATFEEKWNPFLVESAYDHQVMDQIFTPICQINSKNELEPYGGNVSGVQNDDGTALYTVTVNQGMTFSDGTPVTIDDYIYGLYVRADPSYTGPGQMLGTDIEGVENYYYDDPNYEAAIAEFEKTAKAEYAAGKISLENFIEYAKDTNLDGWWNGDPAGDIGNGATWSQYAEDEGFAEQLAAIDATSADAMLALIAEIEWKNYGDAYDTYNWYLSKQKHDYAIGNVADGKIDVPEISGITRVDDYTCTVLYTRIDIYADRGLAAPNGVGNLIPKHYYGDFPKGDVSKIMANMNPLGSGPYIWQGFADNIATCVANASFFKGQPKTGTVRWQFIPQTEIIASLASGVIDIAEPPSSQQGVAEMNSLGLRYDLIDNAGYGYMAMNVERVPLDVRKGYWCLMNRAPSVEGWYGPELAQVIERPMTTTLAEYPAGATAYYPYSREEALKYFEKAGYTQKDGKLVDKNGKQLVLNTYIGGSGQGNHPAYAMLVAAAEDMKALGGEIQIQDVEFNVLQGAMNDGTADAWIMAWGSVYDCDKQSQFHSTGGQNKYRYKDANMDALLEKIVETIDLDARRALVAEMLDLAMDQCLELPLYQRKNMVAYNTTTLNMDTIPTATTAADYKNVLWQVETLN